MPPLDFVERLCDIGDKILSVLKTAAHSDEVRAYSGGDKLLVVHLPVRRARGMQAAGAGVGNVGLDSGKAELFHKRLGRGSSAFYSEAHHSAGAVRQVLFGKGVVLVAGKSAVIYPGDLGVL